MRTERHLSRIGHGMEGSEQPVPDIHLQGGRHHGVEATMLHALLEAESGPTWPMLPRM